MYYNLTLEAWAKVIRYRNGDTAGHSFRLVELCTRLASALGCSEEEIGNLRRGALLHDVGKLAVPDNILLKPGELDDSEKDIIKRHPGIALQMLSGISFLEPSLPVAYCHHE